MWIGKDDFLIHQSQQRIKSRLPEATDSEVKTILASIPGQPPVAVAEMKRRINAARRKASTEMKPVTVVFDTRPGISGLKSITVPPPGVRIRTQTHENIAVNQPFAPADFAR